MPGRAARGASRHAGRALLATGGKIRWRLPGGVLACLALAAAAVAGGAGSLRGLRREL